MNHKRYFGTDGIRGEVGKAPMTPEWFMQLGFAVGAIVQKYFHHNPFVVIGRDPRVSGHMLQSALDAGLLSKGTHVRLLGVVPTPAVALLTRMYGAALGMVISASHNPAKDNGIKFFNASGSKISDELELEIEALLNESHPIMPLPNLGTLDLHLEGRQDYLKYCQNLFPHLTLNGLKIVVDCANGAMSPCAPLLYEALGATVIPLFNTPDGFNINQNCGAVHPQEMAKAVQQHQADVGVSFDGDGDRLIMVDHEGSILDGDTLLYIITKDFKARGLLKGGVVGTVMSNLGLELALKTEGIPFIREKVGDRYVFEGLMQQQWCLGAENSGHILSLEHSPAGDGLISSLLVLDAMCHRNTPLHQLKQGMHKCPQKLVNVPLANVKNVLENPKVLAEVSLVEKQLGAEGRVLLRPSGTEPLLRIMVEGQDEHLVTKLALHLAETIQSLC